MHVSAVGMRRQSTSIQQRLHARIRTGKLAASIHTSRLLRTNSSNVHLSIVLQVITHTESDRTTFTQAGRRATDSQGEMQENLDETDPKPQTLTVAAYGSSCTETEPPTAVYKLLYPKSSSLGPEV